MKSKKMKIIFLLFSLIVLVLNFYLFYYAKNINPFKKFENREIMSISMKECYYTKEIKNNYHITKDRDRCKKILNYFDNIKLKKVKKNEYDYSKPNYKYVTGIFEFKNSQIYYEIELENPKFIRLSTVYDVKKNIKKTGELYKIIGDKIDYEYIKKIIKDEV